jgi:hypothetical protein
VITCCSTKPSQRQAAGVSEASTWQQLCAILFSLCRVQRVGLKAEGNILGVVGDSAPKTRTFRAADDRRLSRKECARASLNKRSGIFHLPFSICGTCFFWSWLAPPLHGFMVFWRHEHRQRFLHPEALSRPKNRIDSILG